MKERQEWFESKMKEFEQKMQDKFNSSAHHEKPLLSDDESTSERAVVSNEPNTEQHAKGRYLRIHVSSSDGDKVRVNLPLRFGRVLLSNSPKISKNLNKTLNDWDVETVLNMIDEGHVGELVNVESADGDTVIIKVE